MAVSRNYFILSRSFRHFFRASLIIAISELLCQVMDLIFVGNLVAAEAFAALDLAIPIETAITGLMLLMTGGAGVIACRHVGNQEFDLANKVQTMAVISAASFAALVSYFGLAFLSEITNALCNEPTLAAYLSEYLRVYFLGLIPMSLYFSLSQIVDIDGAPMIVTRAVVAGCILDLILDVLFMKYFGWGVTGEALADIASYTYPILRFIPYIRSKKCKYSFRLQRRGSGKLLKENILQGIPYCVPYLVTFLFCLTVNSFVMTHYGIPGIYIWGAIYQVLLVGFMFVNFCSRTMLITLGSMLYGCYDMDGIEVLIRMMLRAATIIILILVTTVFLFPGKLIAMFGEGLSSVPPEACHYVMTAVLFLFPYSYCSIKSCVFQILGRRTAASLQMPLFLGFLVFAIITHFWNNPSQLAASMLMALILYYSVDILYSFLCRHRHPNLSRAFLIPHTEIHKLYMSVPCSQSGMNDALPKVEEFLEDCNIEAQLRFGINICCEELMLGLITHNDDVAFFDFLIYEEDDDIKVRAQDVGDPFNPVRHFTKTAAEAYLDGEEMHLSLQIINRICQQLKYNYMYEQNTIYMSFSNRRTTECVHDGGTQQL